MSSVRQDVDRGLEIRDQMEKLKIELKDIETRLQHAALHGEQVDLQDAEREGRQYLATGTERIVPVILTADMIVGEFAAKSERHNLIAVAALGKLNEFYKPVNKFENRFDSGKKFRARASELLDKLAPAFITACLARDKSGIPKSAIKVTWNEVRSKGQ